MAGSKSRRSYTAQQGQERRDWFGTADASAEAVGQWDIKDEALAAAVLGILGAGDAVMFSVTQDGWAVGVTVYSGDSKARKWVTDSIEFDDLMISIARRAKPQIIRIPSEQAAD